VKIYLDSCIVIYLVEGQKSIQDAVVSALREYCGHTIYTSELVRLECRIGPMKLSDNPLLEEYDNFFKNTTILQPNKRIFESATEIRSRQNIKTPDAIHLAFALDNKCDEFWTNDTNLAAITKKIKFRIMP
jgi:predicted nucleic acid-binding protein